MKNIIAIKNRVLFHMDRSRSPRYTNEDISAAIQTAASDFVMDRYDNIKKLEKNYAFETMQRVRDELRTIVSKVLITPNSSRVGVLSTNYMFDVGVRQQINGLWKNSVPKAIGERLGGERNVYFRPTEEYPTHEQIKNEIFCYPAEGVLSSIEMHYIEDYPLPLITDTVIASGIGVLTQGVTYHVEGNSIAYDGTTYQPTDTFTAGANLSFTGTGTVRVIVDVPLPAASHEEIAKRGASILSGIVENFNRNQLKENEIQKQ